MTHPDVHEAMVRLWVAQLRAAREFRRLTQVQVGDRSGMSGQHIWKWESGINLPSVKHLAAWAESVGWELLMVPAGVLRPDVARVAAVLGRPEQDGRAVVSIAAVRQALDLDQPNYKKETW